jgi:branched-chain amino acid transport system permease protein
VTQVVLQSLVDGLTIGTLYGLTAVSINIMYRPSHMFNFGQGNLVLIGALAAFVFIERVHLPWVAGLVGVLLLGALLGGFIEVVAIWPILARSSKATAWILTTLAISLILENIIGQYITDVPNQVRPFPLLSTRPFHAGPVLIESYQIGVWIFAWVMIGGLGLLYQTKHGRAVLALAEDRDAAILRGVPAATLVLVSWVLGGVVALLTGMVAAPITFASPQLGATLLVKGFEAAAVGGLGDNRGAMVGGIVVGLTETYAGIFIDPGYRNLITFAVVMLVLLVRPVGLFGRVTVRAV